MHLCVCLGVLEWMKVKGAYGILTFFNFIVTNINEGVSTILGGRGYPSSHMFEISHVFRVLPKIHLFEM